MIECYIVIPRNFVLCCVVVVLFPCLLATAPTPHAPPRFSSINIGGEGWQSIGRGICTGGSFFFCFYVCFRVDGYLVQSSVPLEPVVMISFSDGFGFRGGVYSRELSTHFSRRERRREIAGSPLEGKDTARSTNGYVRSTSCLLLLPFSFFSFQERYFLSFFRIRACFLSPRS